MDSRYLLTLYFILHMDLEKSLNLTLVLENLKNLKNGPFVLEFGTNVLENIDWSWKKIKNNNSLYFWNAQKELEILDM